MAKKQFKRQVQLRGQFEITQVSALINGIKHVFIRDKIFNDMGVEIR